MSASRDWLTQKILSLQEKMRYLRAHPSIENDNQRRALLSQLIKYTRNRMGMSLAPDDVLEIIKRVEDRQLAISRKHR